MGLFIGIDVGGTFTDFLVMDGNEAEVFKVLSTPSDPSIGFMNGLEKIAATRQLDLDNFVPTIDRIVHGTTVTTNVVLTGTGAKTALLTTEGVRDALEMRRGIREEQYNNRFTNVPPLVPRYLRVPIKGRIDAQGVELNPLDTAGVDAACEMFRRDNVEAVAVCYMNAFAEPSHEKTSANVINEKLPSLYHSISTEVLPSIRFYDRVSTTVLNAYVGPALFSYFNRLVERLQDKGFAGTLLIMQSNGGVVTPEAATHKAAITLLSGPAAGPGAGILYAGHLGIDDCITVDMGGTSFDAALIKDSQPQTVTEGEIARYRLALPMMGIVTIGAGGGSIGWIDEGGLLRMGPKSAGADPGPACYGKGGEAPTCTDADLVLGYLDPDYFAGGAMALDVEAARLAVEKNVAEHLGMNVEEAAAGMYRVINTNMAFGVREATVKRGYDPREFPMVVAGGAGPLHACMIADELEIPFFIVPRESSIFCATGMLMTDLKHDFVRSFVSPWDEIDPGELRLAVRDLIDAGRRILSEEGIPEERIVFELAMDMRYVKQYHELSVPVPAGALGLDEASPVESEGLVFRCGSKARDGDFDARSVLADFHQEHNRLFGYSLEEEKTPVELINIRLRAVGETDKPSFLREGKLESDPSAAFKGKRRAFVPESGKFEEMPVYDALRLGFGAFIAGPALLEQPNTTIFVSGGFDVVVDSLGSYVVFARDKETVLPHAAQEILKKLRRQTDAR
jgi:N-methylhydantoinase A